MPTTTGEKPTTQEKPTTGEELATGEKPTTADPLTIGDPLVGHRHRVGDLLRGVRFDAEGLTRLRREVLPTLTDQQALSLHVVLAERAYHRFAYWRGATFGDLSASGRSRRETIEHCCRS